LISSCHLCFVQLEKGRSIHVALSLSLSLSLATMELYEGYEEWAFLFRLSDQLVVPPLNWKHAIAWRAGFGQLIDINIRHWSKHTLCLALCDPDCPQFRKPGRMGPYEVFVFCECCHAFCELHKLNKHVRARLHKSNLEYLTSQPCRIDLGALKL